MIPTPVAVESQEDSDTADTFHISGATAAPKCVVVVGFAVDFHGEMFILGREGSEVWLRHPQWSLAGSGANLDEAKHSLAVEARDLSDLLRDDDPRELSAEARRLREYVLHF